jgi:hypothetical protein
MKKICVAILVLMIPTWICAQSVPTLSIGGGGTPKDASEVASQDINNRLIEAILNHRVKVRVVQYAADYGIGWTATSDLDRYHAQEGYWSVRCSISINMTGPSGEIVYAKTVTITDMTSKDYCYQWATDGVGIALSGYFGVQ